MGCGIAGQWDEDNAAAAADGGNDTWEDVRPEVSSVIEMI